MRGLAVSQIERLRSADKAACFTCGESFIKHLNHFSI